MRRLALFVTLSTILALSACTDDDPTVAPPDVTETTVPPFVAPVSGPNVGEIRTAGPGRARFGDADVEAWKNLLVDLVRHGTASAAITGHSSPVLRTLFTPRAEAAALAALGTLTDDGAGLPLPVAAERIDVPSGFVFVGGGQDGPDALAVLDVDVLIVGGHGYGRVSVQRSGSVELVRQGGRWLIDGWELTVDRSLPDLLVPLVGGAA